MTPSSRAEGYEVVARNLGRTMSIREGGALAASPAASVGADRPIGWQRTSADRTAAAATEVLEASRQGGEVGPLDVRVQREVATGETDRAVSQNDVALSLLAAERSELQGEKVVDRSDPITRHEVRRADDGVEAVGHTARRRIAVLAVGRRGADAQCDRRGAAAVRRLHLARWI